jgi:hypothetical protein
LPCLDIVEEIQNNTLILIWSGGHKNPTYEINNYFNDCINFLRTQQKYGQFICLL